MAQQRLGSFQAGPPQWAGARPRPRESQRPSAAPHCVQGSLGPPPRPPAAGPGVSPRSVRVSPLPTPASRAQALWGPPRNRLLYRTSRAIMRGTENRPQGPGLLWGLGVPGGTYRNLELPSCAPGSESLRSGPAPPMPSKSQLRVGFTLTLPPTRSSAVLAALGFRHQGRFQGNG